MSRTAISLSILAAVALGAIAAAVPAQAQTGGPFQYYALTPCRIVDTRGAAGVDGGPALRGNATARNFQIKGTCGVPSTAAAVTINVTVVTPSTSGFLTLWPSGGTQPTVSTINFVPADNVLANGAIVPLSSAVDDLAVFFGGSGTTHMLIDVTGYFQ
jgi:hypothetical protein